MKTLLVSPDPATFPIIEGATVDLATGRLRASLTDASRGLNVAVSTLTHWARTGLIRVYDAGRGYDLEDCLKAKTRVKKKPGPQKGFRKFQHRTAAPKTEA